MTVPSEWRMRERVECVNFTLIFDGFLKGFSWASRMCENRVFLIESDPSLKLLSFVVLADTLKSVELQFPKKIFKICLSHFFSASFDFRESQICCCWLILHPCCHHEQAAESNNKKPKIMSSARSEKKSWIGLNFKFKRWQGDNSINESCCLSSRLNTTSKAQC